MKQQAHSRIPVKSAAATCRLLAALLLVITACSPSRTKKQSATKIGTHQIKVIAGCRTEETIGIRNEGVQPAYQFTCLGEEGAIRVVVVQDRELRVNGASFGALAEGDSVTITDGEVQVNGRKVGTVLPRRTHNEGMHPTRDQMACYP